MVTTSGSDVEREAEQKVALLKDPESKGEQEKAPWAPGVYFMIVMFAFLTTGSQTLVAGMSKSGHGGKHAIEYSLAWVLCLGSLVKLVMCSCALPFQVCIRDCGRDVSLLSHYSRVDANGITVAELVPHSRSQGVRASLC